MATSHDDCLGTWVTGRDIRVIARGTAGPSRYQGYQVWVYQVPRRHRPWVEPFRLYWLANDNELLEYVGWLRAAGYRKSALDTALGRASWQNIDSSSTD